MTRLMFRPIDAWPGQLTPNRNRVNDRFQAPWNATTFLLCSEVEKLGNSPEVVVQVAADESAMRLDGGLRATAKVDHPGVIVSFSSKHGSLRYHTDRFTTYQANVRAVALALGDLRRIDRYGIGQRGEQYTGWKALGSGIAVGPAKMSTLDACHTLIRAAAEEAEGLTPSMMIGNPLVVRAAFNAGAKRNHPDRGGDPETFRRITEARDVLIGAG